MKYVKILFAIALVFTMCSAFSLKKDHSKPVYAFGISASFTDTVVYFTDIQILDSAKVSKEGFLSHRELYSYQLKNYLEDNQLQQNSTCMIYFSENKKKLEKEATNNNAFKRYIVLHSYTPMPETEVYPLHLPLGISQGCPVISDEVMRKVDGLLKAEKKPVLLWVYD